MGAGTWAAVRHGWAWPEAGPEIVPCPSCGQECELSPGLQSQPASLPKHVMRGLPLACSLTKGTSSSCPECLSELAQFYARIELKVPGCRQTSTVQGSSFSEPPLPQTCPPRDAQGRSFSFLIGPRANNHQTVRNVPLCQEKTVRLKSPGVLFLEVNVIVLCFLSGFACRYVPLQSPLKREELQGGRLLQFEICW